MIELTAEQRRQLEQAVWTIDRQKTPDPTVAMAAWVHGIVDRDAGRDPMTLRVFTRLHDLDDHPLAQALHAAYQEGWEHAEGDQD